MISVLITLLFAFFSTATFSEEPVRCNDIKKYFERIKCKANSAKRIIGSKVLNIKSVVQELADK